MPYRVVGIKTGNTYGDFTQIPNHSQKPMVNDFTSDEYLQINSCGIFEKITKPYATKNFRGRQDYQIIFVERGGIIVHAPDGDVTLSAGNMILLPPNTRHDYLYLSGCDALWVHFTGRGCEELLERFEIAPFVSYYVSDTGHFRMLAEKIIREYQLRQVGFESVSCAYFVQMLALAKRRIDASLSNSTVNPIDLSPALEDMQTNFAEKRAIVDYAKMCNISSSYFTSLFTTELGMPPYRYLTQIRISQAKHLLLNTNISISEVACSIGYDDPFYFSRIFRKCVGMSPAEFRCRNVVKDNG